MPRPITYALAGALTLALAAPALASPGFATADVNLRAGPGTQYPRVVAIPGGAPVEIFGCLAGASWCDVGFNGIRGWSSSSYLQVAYEGRRVLLPEYAPRVGLPVVAYDPGDYWDRYYRGRPWYAERDRWVAAAPRYAPPPPPRYAGPPPVPPPGWREEQRARAEWREDRERRLDRIQADREAWREERREARRDWRDERRDWRDERDARRPWEGR